MKKHQPAPFVWILSEDLSESAKFLPNDLLDKNIRNLISCLISTRFYFSGIRTQAIFKHCFSDKDHSEETISKIFPLGDSSELLSQHKFSFKTYNNRTSKWCRKCQEHYSLFCEYLRECLTEEEFRFGKIKKSHQFGLTFIEQELLDKFAEKIPQAKISKVIFEWKSIPVKHRRKNIIDGYRSLFLSKIENPFETYAMSRRDIPEFVMEKFKTFAL